MTNKWHITKRRVLVVAGIAGAFAIAAYWSHVRRDQQVANGLAAIRKVASVSELWRFPRSIGPVCHLLFSNRPKNPPDAFKRYAVLLTSSQINDEMIDHLIAIDSLDSITVRGRDPSHFAQVSPLPLEKLPTAASAAAIARLKGKYPSLYVYVDPIAEFESD